MNDPNLLFARAERAFSEGRLADARRDLIRLEAMIQPIAAVLHLRGLVERRSGSAAAAVKALEHALRLEPRNAQIANNLGNALGDTGATDRAIAAYGQALARRPGWTEPLVNRALILDRAGRSDEARLALAAIPPAGRDLRVHLALAGIDLAQGDYDAAAAGYDAALALSPGHPRAARGRARAALERGEADASARYAALVAGEPDDVELNLGLAEALEAEGRPGGEAVLVGAITAAPDWAEGHRHLARMRAEAGQAEYDRSFADALASRPTDAALWDGWIATLAAADRPADTLALIDRARAALGPVPMLLGHEAGAAVEAGDHERAAAALARLGATADPGIALTRTRLALATGRADEAAATIEALPPAERGPAHWALLGLAWRVLGDPRHDWLAGQPGLVAVNHLDFAEGELATLAELLRTLHRTRAHPIGQSLRGGTQTRGRLFARAEPPLRALKAKLEVALARYLAALPAADPAHPLLAHRDSPLRLTGSWSIRLRGSGFHVSHIHSEGIVSSACYIALPPGLGDDAARSGWLEIGGAPPALRLGLAPLHDVQPIPGRLALFPSYLFHGTRPFPAGERLTVAFDVGLKG
ncbi:tetratricopeptide repeat protein [Sphingomonas naphthae]|uniref:Tetratricopeptide repeat protein n=1 Tax=Sphingomonas naphthae TaxID=1813468 RepID=A0ABY7TH19_9SPHN|nr:tetratricopeptide repeat protein [Sphingomonas naphthae]WCT72439.1 tetratricopeptide repeat protein [Sphingomonas naphthae]